MGFGTRPVRMPLNNRSKKMRQQKAMTRGCTDDWNDEARVNRRCHWHGGVNSTTRVRTNESAWAM